MTESVKVVSGGASFMDVSRLPKGIDSLHEILDVLEKHGIRSIDTGRIYGESEELLG